MQHERKSMENHIHENEHTHEHEHINEHTHEHEHSHEHDHEHSHEHEHINEHAHEHTHEHEHSHVHEHVHEHEHCHEHTHEHGHTHENTQAVINRLSRAIGHLESVKRMVESGRDCSEVLVQLAAVKAAINNTGKIILRDHIDHCLKDAYENGDEDAIKNIEDAIDKFVK